MKRNSIKQICASLAAVGILAATVASQAAPKPPASPVGTWDCVSSGAGQPGIGYFTFFDDFTFVADLAVAGSPKPGNVDPRQSGGRGSTPSTTANTATNFYGFFQVEGPWGYDLKGRVIGNFHQVIQVAPDVVVKWNTDTESTGPIVYNVYDYGTDLITVTNRVSFLVDSGDGTLGYMASTNFARTFSGPSSTRTYDWTVINMFDGFTNTYTANLTFYNVTNFLHQAVTNFTYSFSSPELNTNATWSVVAPNGYVNNYTYLFETNNVLGYSLDGVVTNRISFVGTVVPNKRLTLVGSPSLGGPKITYAGVPLNVAKLPDISGSWTGTKREGTVSYIEFFNVTSTVAPYLFSVDGTGLQSGGAGYDVYGYAMVSSQKKIAFAGYEHQWGATNDTLRGSTGPLGVSKTAIKATTKGLHNGNVINFNAVKALP